MMSENVDVANRTEIKLEFGERKITLIGTAHVSKESIDQVTESIKNLNPDCVAVELDNKRADSIQNPDKYGQFDIVKVLRRNEGFLLLANLVLASFQRRMGANVGVKPGDEMLAAMNTATELNIPTVLADRPIQVTLRRAWAKNSLWGKCKLLSALLSSAFSKEEISEEEIESLKKGNEMDSMMDELSKFMPVVKEVLIDERNDYLATKIWEASGNNIVAVLGAGHLPGVEEVLKKLAANEKVCDLESIDKVPPKTMGGKILGWVIPVIIVGLIVAGFIYGGKQHGSEMVLSWILANAIPAGIGSIIAAAHPLTILVSMIAAPFTSLCPFIGVGFVAGILQAVICKPKVHDMETLQDDVMTVKGWYKNRILRVLLVLLLSSLGSSIGTFAGFADIVGKFMAK